VNVGAGNAAAAVNLDFQKIRSPWPEIGRIRPGARRVKRSIVGQFGMKTARAGRFACCAWPRLDRTPTPRSTTFDNTSIRLSGRIVHDLRRSGVRHLIDAGNDPHTVMAFSGHRTDSMLKRYHVINVDDLRRAAERGSVYTGKAGQVVLLRGDERENPESRHRKLISRSEPWLVV
jgi:hypothetical protein